MKKAIFTLTLVLTALLGNAQDGFLRGTVVDQDYGEPAVNATVEIEGTAIKGLTDFDGNYSITLPAGTYNVRYTMFGMQPVVANVTILEGEVTIQDAVLQSGSQVIGDVDIVVQATRNSEVGLVLERKNTSNVMDGLSSQTFRKIGDSNLSGAIGRVTGVSVQDGKYVYVRGLGDRYTKTTLNGMTIPGLDPDKNSVQIDIFPTKTLENVMIYKTFSANLYGDFTGGLVNVETKSFPEVPTTQISVGATYFPAMHFNSDFILYDGGNFDWAGFDDGTRAFPLSQYEDVPANPTYPRSTDLTNSFGKTMAAESALALPNFSLSFNTGDQINTENVTYGYNFVMNYQIQNTYYDEYVSNVFLKPVGSENYELFQDEGREGNLGQRSVLWSALGSGAMKWGTNSLEVLLLHSQGGESSASQRWSQNYNQTGALLREEILTYTQRSLTNNMLIGKHQLDDNWKLEWRNSFTVSRVYDPDFRTTSISYTSGSPTLSVGDGAGINRFWRDLNEWNESFRADVSRNYGEGGKVSFGGVVDFKSRDFVIYNANFRRRETSNISEDPNWFFEEENIFSDVNPDGTYVRYNFEPSNAFTSSQNIFSAYVLNEHYLSTRIKAIYGLRVEQGLMYYTGETQPGPSYEQFNNANTLNELNFLPSAALVYDLNESMKLRASYSMTLARPSFKEKSAAQIFDPLTKRTFIGNLDLEQTNVNNFDLRYEWFFEGADLFAVSGFYKTFENHIELVSFQTAPDNITPRNAGSSTVFGAEVEISKSLEFLAESLKNFKLGGNFSYVESRVDLHSVIVDANGQTEFELRQANLRDGEELKEYRPMAGQAPYTLNLNLNYAHPESGLNLSAAYNVQGTFLAIVGSGRVPDVYTVPFHSLNFNAFMDFGEESRHRITLGVNNALNGERHNVYRSFRAQDETYSRFLPGVGISLKYGYRF
ncbi:TonB-dependent receptor domain-containing protein [Phaeocystidibacter luteus]|uniref:TonB-dependent receptor plug domain-containing protein n=1 Tax=Phaeocystidibacter luteus TaxID=911197 RepID=A0A6N6RKP9_9FLAO|nr:TonB-dependent receptor [Phaeocystidibacter luteus]KAB2813700.1 TonB-dependent receptor plug domain-containing protein [Phaeocystidibacter luteus]